MQPLRRFGSPVGEGRFGTDPDRQIAAFDEFVVRTNGLIESRNGRFHGAHAVREQIGAAFYEISGVEVTVIADRRPSAGGFAVRADGLRIGGGTADGPDFDIRRATGS